MQKLSMGRIARDTTEAVKQVIDLFDKRFLSKGSVISVT
jgi:hypothetical protein